jgi:hypothetical protein
MTGSAKAEDLLAATGAADLPHPGGTLLAHLRRVRDLLAGWGAPETVWLAGLCHAAYGTDGFGTALLGLTERHRLAAAIGPDAEQLVYLYGSCDRAVVHPRLGEPAVTFADRFTGAATVPPEALVRGFAEITAANELDVLRHDAGLAARHGDALRGLVRRAERHLSPAAVEAWRHF